ncbi:MAG: CxxC-x17-CxxC domain-containing protein [bacterium]
MDEINFFAKTDFRNQLKRFGIRTDDRRRHMYVVGKTGMGKTAMLENMAIQDIQSGRGLGFVDPHGEAAERLLDFVPPNRINDVIYFNPADVDFPIAFNIMEKVNPEYRHLVSGGLMGVFKKIWPDVWSARMEYILNNSILALLEYPDSTLLGVNRILSDVEYRKKVIAKITDPIVRSFWVTEFARYSQRYETEATAAIQNKIGQFISAPVIRNIIGQVKSSLNMREIMDEERILILNLSKGKVGEDASRLLGSLLVTKLQLAAMSRVDIPEEKRKDFFLYVDEFQNFATESFVNILSEARKYRLALILGHQYVTQMEEEVRDAVFGNVGTIVTFRVGAEDAEFFEKEFLPEFTARDIVNLAKYNIYLKLMINGIAGQAFSAQTLPPFVPLQESNKEKIIKVSRERYGVPRQVVEEKISRWASTAEQAFTPLSPVSRPLYDAKCNKCGKEIKVIFPPDGVRPVYCKTCLNERGAEKTAKTEVVKKEAVEPTVSLRETLGETLKEATVSFSGHREDKPRQKRKEVDMSELKKALSESFEEKEEVKEEEKEEIKKGIINPGEVIKF